MNAIELVTKYLPVLDEQYRAMSKSAILDTPPEFIQMTKDAKKFKVAKITTDKLGTYSRHSGFVKGFADLTWEEHEYTYDRGRSIQIDDMDNEETFGLAFGRLAGTFQKEAVIPEIDAIRFAKYYAAAYTHLEFAVTSGEILSLIDDLDAQFDDDEVPENDRICFVAPTVYKMMINDPELRKNIEVRTESAGSVNKKFYYYNDHLLIKVPSSRFYTEIDLYDGSTSGQEDGGYVAGANAKAIGILMVQRDAVIQSVKRNIARVWAPTPAQMSAGLAGVNPDADAWKFDFRIYHDAWVLDNKTKGIAGAIITSAAVTAVEIYSEDEGVEIASSAATVSLAAVPSFDLRVNVTATGDPTTAVVWSEDDETVGTVDSSGHVTLKATGTLKVTATSVWNPSVSDTVTITVNA